MGLKFLIMHPFLQTGRPDGAKIPYYASISTNRPPLRGCDQVAPMGLPNVYLKRSITFKGAKAEEREVIFDRVCTVHRPQMAVQF